jgi:biopolymer transport protein ExbD
MNRKRRLFQGKKRPRESGMLSLQITSMADIFTILLVFLLKGIANDALALTPSGGVTLPVGVNTSSISDSALTVELSPKGVLIEKELVAEFPDFEKAVSARLHLEREKHTLIAHANTTLQGEDRVILLSDAKVPFSTLKRVLSTLSQNGYSDIKFGVIKE